VVGQKNRVRIYIEEEDKFGRLKSLKRALPSVVVKVSFTIQRYYNGIYSTDHWKWKRSSTLQGLPPIIRGIIRLDEKTQERQLLCEGHALLEVMNTPGTIPFGLIDKSICPYHSLVHSSQVYWVLRPSRTISWRRLECWELKPQDKRSTARFKMS
jgi:hypothetical protein